VRHAEALLAPLGAQIAGSQIVPLIVGADDRAMALAGALQTAGYDVRGIRPPTVRRGTARLRISITLNASLADIDGLAAALAAATVPG
jgi:8-amino-7-oxononanoate synthase